MLSVHSPLVVLKGKGRGSFYIAQYPVHWIAQSALHFLPSLTELRATTKSLTFPLLSIARYSFIQLSRPGRQWREGKCPIFQTVAKGGFEPGLTWLRVRHSTTELHVLYTRSLIPGMSLVALLCIFSTTFVSFLRYGLDACIQYSKWGLTIALGTQWYNQTLFFICYISAKYRDSCLKKYESTYRLEILHRPNKEVERSPSFIFKIYFRSWNAIVLYFIRRQQRLE